MAPRSIWRGSITFGLISIPVKVYSAVGRESGDKIDLHLLHAEDGARIRYSRSCDNGHEDIPWDQIVRGFEYAKDQWVEITDDDLGALELESLRTIDIDTFVPYDQIDPMYFDTPYYLVPDEPAIKAYRLIIDALADEGLVGLAKVAMRDREHLCVLRVTNDVLVMETMHWPEEIRQPQFDELGKKAAVSDRERQMARQLIQQLTGDFQPERFQDQYHQALKQLIDRKVQGEETVVQEPAEEQPSGVVDLMEALKASVEAAKKNRQQPAASGSDDDGETDVGSLSKKELEERARELNISGRSKMDKDELAEAIRAAS